MAKFVSISGPSTTGKTSILSYLKNLPEFSNVICGSDLQDLVWDELVDRGLFTEFTDVCSDNEYLSTFILKMIDYYNNFLDAYEHEDVLVFLDSCWIDLSVYSVLNTWYNRTIREVQEEIFRKVLIYDNRISKIYLTKTDDKNYPVDKFRLRGKMSTFRANRPLEIQYFEVAKHFKESIAIPTSDIVEAAEFILDDLKKSGYLS